MPPAPGNARWLYPAGRTLWGDSTFAGDKITGLKLWYAGFGNSNYAKTSNEFTGTNGQVTSAVTNGLYIVDTSLASGGSKTAAILAEVCKVITEASFLTRAVGITSRAVKGQV